MFETGIILLILNVAFAIISYFNKSYKTAMFNSFIAGVLFAAILSIN